MPVLNSQAVADTYPLSPGARGAILANVWNARGGFFAVSAATAFVQLQYGTLGEDHWTDEILVGNGAFVVLPANVVGVQFRNGVAGLPATVTAQIAQGDEPPLEISTFGTVTVTGSGVQYQHNGTVVANEPALDFDDGLLVFGVADDNANTRVRVTGGVGLTGATAAARFVGGTASGAPAAGTFAIGDYVVDQTGALWVCITAGTPGTWKLISGKPPTRTFFNVNGPNAYTPPAGCRAVIGQCVGSGGGGGGTAATGAATAAAGGGGGGGAFSEGLIAAPFTNTPWTATVGLAGQGAAGAGGGNGNTSQIADSTTAVLIAALGGTGGALGAAITPPSLGALGGQGGLAAGGGGSAAQFKLQGQPGAPGLVFAVASFVSGLGGAAARGGGGAQGQTNSHAGANGASSGSGGGGAAAGISQGTFAGGNGGDGLIVIYEFY